MKADLIPGFILALTFSFFLAVTSGCSLLGLDDDGNDAQIAALLAAALLTNSSSVCTTTSLSGTISSNTNGCGTLNGIVTVESGATLTINAGTTVQAQSGSALIIKPGGRLVAVGTASNPIIFTSSKSAGARAAGDWGGITLVGTAPNSNSTAQAIEASSSITYGGSAANTSTDSSGALQYVRIEFSGGIINSTAQNCLSLYGVGSATTIDHVQCHMSADDGFVWFGGTVNAKNLLSTGIADDSFEMTEGYTGALQYLIAHQYTAAQVTHSATPYGMDVYGTSTGAAPSGNAGMSNPTIQNFSLHGGNVADGRALVAQNGMQGSFQTGTMYNYAVRNIRCIDNGGGGTATNPNFDVRSDSSKANASGGECVQITTDNTLAAQPFTSAGDVASNTAPDYTSTAGTATCGASAATSFLVADATCGGMTTTSGNWSSGWTFYQPN